eukprot:c12978_g1_i1.p1 GENE.c12978_g1_i1~~c12978_g1_i1.p1  ORF type:complete len:291 (+),score=74.85 c12978_g1_i1:129-1001(+)
MSADHQRQDVQSRQGPDASTVLITLGKEFVVRNPRISIAYVIGILVCLLANGFTPSPAAVEQMESKMGELGDLGHQIRIAQETVWQAEERYYNSKGWFFSCNQLCQQNKKDYEIKLAKLQTFQHQYNRGVAEANANVGVFSTYGVQQSRELFWRMFGHGKNFAKRQTMWDALFVGISTMSRDESLIEFGLRLLINMLFNFTVGLFGALVAFAWNLWSIISSFGADLLTGAAFFTIATVAATSFCVSWILALYGAAAGTVYVVVKAAANSAIEGNQQRRRNPHLEQRTHWQ